MIFRRPKVYIILFVLILIVSGCKKSNITLLSKERLLTRTMWIMNSFIDMNQNLSMEVSNSKYEFRKDGKLIVYPDSESEPKESEWAFTDKEKHYLRMGDNEFKVLIISRNLLGLEYGSVRIYYVPVD